MCPPARRPHHASSAGSAGAIRSWGYGRGPSRPPPTQRGGAARAAGRCRRALSARPFGELTGVQAPSRSKADLGQPDGLVAARRPLEPVAHAVDVHLLVPEDPRRVVADQAQELAVELLPLLRV